MYRSSPFRSTLNTSCITGLDMSKVCTEAVHSVALWTRVTFQDTKARPAWEKSGNTGNTYGRWVWDGARGEASGRKNWGYLCGCRQVNHLVRHGRIHLPKCPHTSARINSIHVPMTKHNLGGSRRASHSFCCFWCLGRRFPIPLEFWQSNTCYSRLLISWIHGVAMGVAR